MESVGFGIIGTSGLWSELHARIFSTTQGIYLAGVADLTEHKAVSFAQSYGTMHHTHYHSLLLDEMVKAVSIMTPPHTHAEVVLAAVEAGKDVLVEPPLALTPGACTSIFEAIEKSQARVMVNFRNRWIRPFKKLRESLHKAGNVQYITLQTSARIDVPTEKLGWADETTIEWFLGIHSVDTVCWMLDQTINRVYTMDRLQVLKAKGIDTPDYYQAIAQLDSGATVYLEDSWISPASRSNLLEFSIKIVGDKDVVHECIQYPETILDSVESFEAESVREFIKCVIDHKEMAITSEDALRATMIVHSMEISAATGVSVQMG